MVRLRALQRQPVLHGAPRSQSSLDDVYQERLDSGLAAEVHATVEALLAATGSERFTALPEHSPEELEEWRRRRSARPAP